MHDLSMAAGILLVLGSNFLAGLSQILLKRSAGQAHTSRTQEYINWGVIGAYGIFFFTTVLSLVALRWIPLSLCAALGASGQVFVPLLSRWMLKEHISRKKALGMAVIVLGLVIYAL